MTLTLTWNDLESHIVVNVSLTLTNTTIWFVAALSLIVDVPTYGRTYLRTDIFTRFIRSSLRLPNYHHRISKRGCAGSGLRPTIICYLHTQTEPRTDTHTHTHRHTHTHTERITDATDHPVSRIGYRCHCHKRTRTEH